MLRGAWILFALASLAAIPIGWRSGWPVAESPAISEESDVAEAATGSGASSEAGAGLLRLAGRMTPFRLLRSVPTSRYAGAVAAGTPVAPAPPAAPKPVLILSGILWGPSPEAILDGIPGQAGAVVVHPGMAVGALKVTTIERTRVRVVGMDTVWNLTVRVPWP